MIGWVSCADLLKKESCQYAVEISSRKLNVVDEILKTYFPLFCATLYSLLRVETYKELIPKNVPKLNLMYQVTTAKCIAIHDWHFLRIISALDFDTSASAVGVCSV